MDKSQDSIFEKEIWTKTIELGDNILLSNTGKIKSIDRSEGFKKVSRKRKGKLLKLTLLKTGYKKIKYYSKSYFIHFLVLKYFSNSFNPEYLIFHKDNNFQNNRINNLEWVTTKDNIVHSFEIGLNKSYGENNFHSKLKELDVLAIRSSSLSISKLSEQYKVARHTITSILDNKSWKQLK